jgi:hypothetical protein
VPYFKGFLLIVWCLTLGGVDAHSQETFLVTSSSDSGAATLREAITRANLTPQQDVVELRLPHGAVISIQSALPVVTAPLQIVGEQPASIMLAGDQAGDVSGLVIRSDDVSVVGLSVVGFARHGIEILGFSRVYIHECRIGVLLNDEAAPNGAAGIHIEGGTEHGVTFNVISANRTGIEMRGGRRHHIGGNRIGAVGDVVVGNREDGIDVRDAIDLLIGDAGCRTLCINFTNWIAGNGASGLHLSGENTTVTGNFIGSSDASAEGNRTHGVVVDGGRMSISGNMINSNAGDGVRVLAGLATIRGNIIRSNGGIPVDVGGEGATANDFLDYDDGPNHFQNAPVLTEAKASADGWYVKGYLASEPLKQYSVDLISNSDCGETAPFAASPQFVTTNAEGRAEFAFAGAEAGATGFSVAAIAPWRRVIVCRSASCFASGQPQRCWPQMSVPRAEGK